MRKFVLCFSLWQTGKNRAEQREVAKQGLGVKNQNRLFYLPRSRPTEVMKIISIDCPRVDVNKVWVLHRLKRWGLGKETELEGR